MPSRARSASWPDAVLAAVLTSLVVLAWWSLWLWTRSPQGHLLMHTSTYRGLPEQRPLWFAVIYIAGWTLMTIAMMLPTAVPLLVTFQRIAAGRRTTALLLALVIAGYLGVWMAGGAMLLILNWLLHALVQPAAPWIVATVILTIAGLFQFSRLKYACLDKCRSPLSFVIEHWRGGNEYIQSLRLGAAHGIFCVGCCWSLMLLMFIVGAGSLAAMLVLGLVMAVEKNFAWGRRLGPVVGVILLGSAAATLVSRILL